MGVGEACRFKQCKNLFTEKVTFEQKLEGGKGIRYANISGNRQKVE